MICPQCEREFVPKGGRGRPRRFCSDDCRKAWNSANGVIANEIAWHVSAAEAARQNAQRYAYGDWLKSARRHDGEVERLTVLLAERKGTAVPGEGPCGPR
jgi:hypothetical protein